MTNKKCTFYVVFKFQKEVKMTSGPSSVNLDLVNYKFGFKNSYFFYKLRAQIYPIDKNRNFYLITF